MKFLFLVLFLVGCAHQQYNHTETETPPVVTVPPIIVVTPSPGEPAPKADVLKVVFTSSNFKLWDNGAPLLVLKQAETLTQIILNSKEYREKLIAAYMTETNGLSNYQIYDKVMQAAEYKNPVANHQMDVNVIMYYKGWSSVVGYGVPATADIYTNYKFYADADACYYSSNLVHEWFHKLGFDHLGVFATSVPYVQNTIIDELCPLALQGKLTKGI